MVHTHAPGLHAHGSSTRAFAIVTLVNLAYALLEAGYGFHVNSLALLSDALHNLGDVLGLGLAWAAASLARRRPTERHTYGWRRATLLSPLVNAVLLMVFAGALGWEAVRRFGDPPMVPGLTVVVVASVGILVNLWGAWLMRGDHAHDLNKRGAYLHLMADAGVSLAAVLAGIGMLAGGWSWLDPLVALLVGVVVAAGSYRLLRDSFDATMDAVPAGIDPPGLRQWLQEREGVLAVHHLHVWRLGAGEIALTAHLVRAPGPGHDAFIEATARALDQRFGINHATLQVEHGDACAQPLHDAAPHHPH